MESTNQKRQTAKIIDINSLNLGTYKKEEGWDPNFILTKSGEKIYRVNLIATVLSVKDNDSNQMMVIDDGTSQIDVRNFDETLNLSNFVPEDTIILIAKPREYGTIYLMPEIIKKIDNPLWIKVRAHQLKNIKSNEILNTTTTPIKVETKKIEKLKINNEELLEMIREMDSGDGVDIDELLEKVQNEDMVSELVRQGEIFEIKPGRIKVLE